MDFQAQTQTTSQKPFSNEEIMRLMWVAKIGREYGEDLCLHRLRGDLEPPLLSWDYIHERLKWYEEGDWGQLP